MGLDVYLYRYDDKALTDRLEAEYEAESERLWEATGRKYEQLTQTEKDDVHSQTTAVATRLGLGTWGSDDTRKRAISHDSARYPEHMFKVGYFRSSYNEGGIDRVLRTKVDATLGSIMGEAGEYTFQPDWAASRQRALDVLVAYQKVLASQPYRAYAIETRNQFAPQPTVVDSESAALRLFDEQRAKQRPSDFQSFDSIDGQFSLKEPRKVFALIRGVHPFLSAKEPCIWVVEEWTAGQWYAQALEIVIETCDYVIAQPDSDKYWLHWSG